MTKNKVAIITGASRGIGEAIALKLDKGGFITVLVGRNKKNLKTAQKDFSKKAIVIPADVSKENEVIAIVRRVVKKFGRIDVLINCAGWSAAGKIEELSENDFERTVNSNLGGVFYCSREVIKQMKTQSQGGQIINISSMAAKMPLSFPKRSLHCAIKAAIGVFAQNIQEEVKNYSIKIATIYPNFVLTDSLLRRGTRDPEELRKYAPMPEDVGWLVLMIVNQGEKSNISEVIIR